jgi:two-component system sensor histidine kinase KdpD
LVSNLLDASRLEAGALAPDRRPHDLTELIDTAVRRLEPRLANRPLTVDIPETLPPVAYDYTQVDRIITNLLENALVHTPAGSPLEIRVRASADEIRIKVSDHGPGVPPEDRERLFGPFERGRTGGRGRRRRCRVFGARDRCHSSNACHPELVKDLTDSQVRL